MSKKRTIGTAHKRRTQSAASTPTNTRAVVRQPSAQKQTAVRKAQMGLIGRQRPTTNHSYDEDMVANNIRAVHSRRNPLITISLVCALVIAAALGVWFAVEPTLEKERMLEHQSDLLESIEEGDGIIVVSAHPDDDDVDFYGDAEGGWEMDVMPMSGIQAYLPADEPTQQNVDTNVDTNSSTAQPGQSATQSGAHDDSDDKNPSNATNNGIIGDEPPNETVITGIGVLTIGKIDLKLPVTDGVSKAQLKVAIGHVPQTPPIGSIGNAVVAGHRSYTYGQYFNRMDELVVGDIIGFQSKDGEQMTFKVYETLVILPGDESAFEQPEDKQVLTLYTCTPVRIASHRLLIRAERIL